MVLWSRRWTKQILLHWISYWMPCVWRWTSSRCLRDKCKISHSVWQTLHVVYSVPCRVGNYNWGYFLSSLVEQNKCTSHTPGVEGWDKGHECSLKVRHQGWVVRKWVNANPRLKVHQIFNFSCIKMFLLLMVCVVWFHTSSTVKNKKDIYMQQTSLKNNTKLISKFFRLAWSGFLNNAALLLLVFAIVQPSHPSSDSPTHPFILRILAFMSVPVQISDC